LVKILARSAGYGHLLLDHLYAPPIISVNEVIALTQTSFQSANSLIARFVQHGLLLEITGQARNRRFIYQPYLDLFIDRIPGVGE